MIKDDQSTSIIQHYLWAVGLNLETFTPGTLLGDRYRVVDSQIVTDTQMYRLPEIPEEITFYVNAYLRLSRLPLHIPRPYGLVKLENGGNSAQLLLLDKAPIAPEGRLYPNIRDRWIEASPIQQIHLLWQILQLWQPLLEQSMTSTLLDPEVLRVYGPWIRILEILPDQDEIKLSQIGDLWIEWLADAKSEVAESLADFVYGLSRGDFDLGEAIACLDQLAQAQFEAQYELKSLTIRIASGTDKGPRRDHNEDTCYPTPERQKRSQQSEKLRDRLAIICDGLGGHEGGEIASSMAIKTIEQHLQVLLDQVETSSSPFVPEEFIAQLDDVIKVANDQIVNLNDKQFRQAQQRMGTTLVMVVAPRPQGKLGHEVYVVSVGDSRVYWVHSQSYDQITIDDDVATRDVMLGYNFHAYSSQRIDGGALIQALGTRPSEMLYPRIQRLPIDEDCLLLLCSDGLSDYDRVDEIMDSHVRPILTEDLPLDEAVKELIDQANTRNGHDNVTVALMRCRFAAPDSNEEPITEIESMSVNGNIQDLDTFYGEESDLTLLQADHISNDESKKNEDTEGLPKKPQSSLMLLGLLVVLIIVGAIAATQAPSIRQWLDQNMPGRSQNQ